MSTIRALAERRLKDRYGVKAWQKATLRAANINATKARWWLDIPISTLECTEIDHIDLALFDHRTDELHHIQVPRYVLEGALRQGNLAERSGHKVSIELEVDGKNKFRDLRAGDRGLSFARYLVPVPKGRR